MSGTEEGRCGTAGTGVVSEEEVGGADRTEFRIGYEWVGLRYDGVGLLGQELYLRKKRVGRI